MCVFVCSMVSQDMVIFSCSYTLQVPSLLLQVFGLLLCVGKAIYHLIYFTYVPHNTCLTMCLPTQWGMPASCVNTLQLKVCFLCVQCGRTQHIHGWLLPSGLWAVHCHALPGQEHAHPTGV